MPSAKKMRIEEPAVGFVADAPPSYLQKNYWWAYIHPLGVWFFDRVWMVNIILWGNYQRLRREVLKSFDGFGGRALQLACCYGDLTPSIASCMGKGGQLDIIDVLPIQLQSLSRKLKPDTPVRAQIMDSTSLAFNDASYDLVLLFFLLHEQPEDARRQTIAEALRVLRPGGGLVVADFAQPARFHPIRIWLYVLGRLEPFARDLWNSPVTTWFPYGAKVLKMSQKRFFGGWFQVLTFVKVKSE